MQFKKLNMAQLIDNIQNRLHHYVNSGQLSNADLVQLIEQLGGYLNLQSRSAWARESGKSYNAAKKFRQNITLFGSTFVIDN